MIALVWFPRDRIYFKAGSRYHINRFKSINQAYKRADELNGWDIHYKWIMM